MTIDIDKLNVLRGEIDKIDQDILKLLSRRLSLVSKVGDIKSHFGLFIYDEEREEIMVSQRRQEALKLGISSDLIEDVLRRVMRESYDNESEKGFKKFCPHSRSVVIVGGRGRMGQFFLKMLTLSGYIVKILDQDDWINAESILNNVGIVFISVPMHKIVKIVNKLPRLPDDCIVVDLSSTKIVSLRVILNVHNGPVLGLHPMFSPDIKNMIKQVVICCEGRYPESYQWVLQQLKLWGARLYYCNAEEHDKYMSVVQGLYHFITFVTGYHLFKENINLKKFLSFSSSTFYLNLVAIGRLFIQDPQLYANIIMSSRNNIILIKRYYTRLGEILTLLERNNKHEFIKTFKEVNNWLGVYGNKLFNHSFKLLKYVNDNKK